MLRSFGRPIQAIGLSPEFRHDRSYLSAGLAGNLVLTVGGKAGTSSVSSTSSGNPLPVSGWLGALGLSSSAKDTILHSGEGAISALRWSTTGKYVAWVNEKGVKIMKGQSQESQHSWKRISHVDRPQTPQWNEMCNSWKGRLHWVDPDSTSPDKETLLIGWGDALWIIKVQRGKAELLKL
jgi:hypothetical protein